MHKTTLCIEQLLYRCYFADIPRSGFLKYKGTPVSVSKQPFLKVRLLMELTRARIISIAVTFALSKLIVSKRSFMKIQTVIFSAFTGWGCILAIQPPFYPLEAEKKGARPSQYGFVFGMLNLTAFIFAPLFGRYGGKVGAKVLFIFGAFTQGIVGILFGFLDFVQTATPFLSLSYIFR